MIFNDFHFVFLFLPIVLAGFFFPPMRRWRVAWLVAASALFYGLSGLEHLVVLIMGVIWVYLLTRTEHIVGNRPLLVIAIIGPLLALVYYKYSGFIVDEILMLRDDGTRDVFSLFDNILLPAGISFFTFQMIAFAIDRYRGEIPQMPSFGRLALYISFFPQLVAGPILRFRHVAERLSTLTIFKATREDISAAVGYICFGYAAKVLLADSLHHYLEPLIGHPGALSVGDSVFVIFAYSFQIYFDFYGYSLIAIGLGRLFGFRFPHNFLRPYEALNPRDFWRRWHTTLSYWIRDYLYIPLGGNRRYEVNIVIVFAVVGLWHGAGLTFIVWGLYHGALVVGYKLTRAWWDKMPAIIQKALNFTVVSFGWILFLFDFADARSLCVSLLGQGAGDPASLAAARFWGMLLIAAVVCFQVHFERIADKVDRRPRMARAYSVALGGLALVSLLFTEQSETFIYFRF